MTEAACLPMAPASHISGTHLCYNDASNQPPAKIDIMSQSQKYQYRILPAGSAWTAEIVRRVSAKKETVSKRQTGFGSEAEAQTWAEGELAAFQQLQSSSNQRRAKLRQQKQQAREARIAARREQ